MWPLHGWRLIVQVLQGRLLKRSRSVPGKALVYPQVWGSQKVATSGASTNQWLQCQANGSSDAPVVVVQHLLAYLLLEQTAYTLLKDTREHLTRSWHIIQDHLNEPTAWTGLCRRGHV